MKFTNDKLIKYATNLYRSKLRSLEYMSPSKLKQIIDKYKDSSSWNWTEEGHHIIDIDIDLKNTFKCYMKAVKGELQERDKGMPYSNEINFLKEFIENDSNSLPFEITIDRFNGKLYKIKYEVDVDKKERNPFPDIFDVPLYDSNNINGYVNFISTIISRRISIICNDGRKMTIVRGIVRYNCAEKNKLEINYEVTTKDGKAFYPYKFSCEELNYFKEMFFQKIAEAIIEQEQKEKELQEGTKKFVKTLCNQRH